ncbi:MAG: methanogenesis marker 2 protein [Vulcanimicrobiaceae bacterium]
MTLAALLERLRTSAAMTHKRDIATAYAGLGRTAGTVRVGDDTAAIPDGDGYLLFAIEGLLEAFVRDEPWFAGYCSVMVNCSDVAAMGGRTLAVVDALWSASAERARALFAGMRAASEAYGVPIVGGHTNAWGDGDRLAVAVLGRARRLLTSFDARPGDALVLAVDLRGRYFGTYPFWNASTDAPHARLRDDLELLPDLAELGLCAAAKDVSNAGLLGTLLMLLECSGVGARVALECVPMPPRVTPERWLASFPSFGYLLAVAPDRVDRVRRHFAARDIACAAIGTCEPGARLVVTSGAQSATFWDLDDVPFTGAPTPARA